MRKKTSVCVRTEEQIIKTKFYRPDISSHFWLTRCNLAVNEITGPEFPIAGHLHVPLLIISPTVLPVVLCFCCPVGLEELSL